MLATASAFSWTLARAGAPQQLAQLPMFEAEAPAWMILLALNVILLILGCVMEAIAILMIIVPMILPIALKAGIDPVHLGVVMSFNLSIGLITPPFGSIMFVMCGIAKVSITTSAARRCRHRHPDRQAAGTANEGHSGDYESPPWPCQWFQKS